MGARYQKRPVPSVDDDLLLSGPVCIGGEADAANPGHADRWRIEMDRIDIEAGERLQLERLPEVLAWAVVALDQRSDPGDDRNLDIRRALIASLGAVPGQAATDRLLANDDRTFTDGLTHRRLVDDVVGAGHPEIELDDWLVDLLSELSCHDSGNNILDGRGVGVHHHVALSGVGGNDECTGRVGVWVGVAQLRLLE